MLNDDEYLDSLFMLMIANKQHFQEVILFYEKKKN